MNKIIKWFSNKPHTKAMWVSALTAFVTLIVIAVQTSILVNQSRIATQQILISKAQNKLISNQIEASTRPYIDFYDQRFVTDSLIITNYGQYPIKNVQMRLAYLAYIRKHGWYSAITPPIRLTDTLEPNQKWYKDMTPFVTSYLQPPMSPRFISKNQIEHLNLLVTFERRIDGQKYIAILPGDLVRNRNGIERWTRYGNVGTGPLAKLCHDGLEITYELLKRTNLGGDYALYNSSYPLGYEPTGCLGKIIWLDQ